MRTTRMIRNVLLVIAIPAAAFVVGWIVSAAVTYARFGRAHAREPRDPIVDRFMPRFEIDEVHETEVEAPASVTLAAAREIDLNDSPVIHAIFRGREMMLRARSAPAAPRKPFLDQVLELGWGVLAEEPGHEIVIGAITKPWEANVRFIALPPERFAAFDSAGWVKIVWTLAVDSLSPTRSRFRTETRVLTTDATARSRFRRYWSVFSPGILLIRHETLKIVRRAAEARMASHTA